MCHNEIIWQSVFDDTLGIVGLLIGIIENFPWWCYFDYNSSTAGDSIRDNGIIILLNNDVHKKYL